MIDSSPNTWLHARAALRERGCVAEGCFPGEAMTASEFDRFCASLPATRRVVQWGGAHVWKVGGKVFAICWDKAPELHVTFKCSDLSYDLPKDIPGCRPAPYLASRGMTWVQRTRPASIDDEGLRSYIAESHHIVASGLSRKTQHALGLALPCPARTPRAVRGQRSNQRQA